MACCWSLVRRALFSPPWRWGRRDGCQVELVVLLGFLIHVQFPRCLGKVEDRLDILMIEDGRIFEAVVSSFVVAGLQVELADADIFGGALWVVDIGGAVRGFELELLAFGVVEAELVGVVEAGASLRLLLRWSWVVRIGASGVEASRCRFRCSRCLFRDVFREGIVVGGGGLLGGRLRRVGFCRGRGALGRVCGGRGALVGIRSGCRSLLAFVFCRVRPGPVRMGGPTGSSSTGCWTGADWAAPTLVPSRPEASSAAARMSIFAWIRMPF